MSTIQVKALRLILFLAVFHALSADVLAQRYLSPVFPGVDTTLNIQYGSAIDYQGASASLLLDFYAPQGDTLAARPLIIYIHGGGFVDVNQSKSLAHIMAFADSMARRGYTVATINYRLDTSISNRAVIHAMHDAKASVRFFRANAATYRIDSSLIFIGGESAGAITALNTNYIDQVNEVQYPPTAPFANDTSVEGSSGSPGFPSHTKATLCYCGGSRTIVNELLFDTLAMQSAADPPFLMLHGSQDSLIPIAAALDVALRATNQSIPNLFYPLYGATHCPWFFPLPNSAAYLDTLIAYTVPFLYACVQTSTAVTPAAQDLPLQLFPNPNTGSFWLQNKGVVPLKGEVSIYDSRSQRIYQAALNFADGQMKIELGPVAPGIYFLQVRAQNGNHWQQKIFVH